MTDMSLYHCSTCHVARLPAGPGDPFNPGAPDGPLGPVSPRGPLGPGIPREPGLPKRKERAMRLRLVDVLKIPYKLKHNLHFPAYRLYQAAHLSLSHPEDL